MNKKLRKLLSDEIQRRHGYRFMEAKLKPVHIANALMRTEHECVGRMSVLEKLFEATLAKNSVDKRAEAVRALVDGKRDRWGRLGETEDFRSSSLMNKLLPLIRTLLAADGAAYGTSPEFSSFSSPTALTVTGDASDDGAGSFVFRLWSGIEEGDRLEILDLLSRHTAPGKKAAQLDDLSALLAPLVDSIRKKPRNTFVAEDLATTYSQVESGLRESARGLAAYELKLDPNPIATLQRIVLLAALSVFMHAATRPRERYGNAERFLLLDASGDPSSNIANASTQSVARLIADGRAYMSDVLCELLRRQIPSWQDRPLDAINALLETSGHAPVDASNAAAKRLLEIKSEAATEELEGELAEELIRSIEGSSGRGLDGYLRLLGIRAGFLYPQQKNPKKRLVPTDRTLEVLVASVIDVGGHPLEYRDFLEQLRGRWAIIVGGSPGDSAILNEIGAHVPARELAMNSERLLTRLDNIGLARRLADSVAVVGLMEECYE